jgi:hypothetical protein
MSGQASSEARIRHNQEIAIARRIAEHVTTDDARAILRRLVADTDANGSIRARDWLIELQVLADLHQAAAR